MGKGQFRCFADYRFLNGPCFRHEGCAHFGKPVPFIFVAQENAGGDPGSLRAVGAE
jgi:hypothetical protein